MAQTLTLMHTTTNKKRQIEEMAVKRECKCVYEREGMLCHPHHANRDFPLIKNSLFVDIQLDINCELRNVFFSKHDSFILKEVSSREEEYLLRKIVALLLINLLCNVFLFWVFSSEKKHS